MTIARVRDPMYNKEIGLIDIRMMGISMVINPELATAMEIARLLRFPSAIKIDTFAKGPGGTVDHQTAQLLRPGRAERGAGGQRPEE